MYASNPHRLTSALASATVLMAIGGVLIFGLTFTPAHVRPDALVSLSLDRLRPPPPSRPPPPRHVEGHRARHAASPRNLRNQATPIVAPILPALVIAPVIAAPKPALGLAANQGASDRVGTGQGAGGSGDGTGGGGSGDGDGDFTAPHQIAGSFDYGNLPQALRAQHVGGRVLVRYTVGISGRVTGCRTIRSSGLPALDDATCELILKRLRFDPSRDAAGRPVDAALDAPVSWTYEH